MGYLVAWSGFNPKATVQTAEVLTRIRWFAFTPHIAFSLAAMYFAWRFPITEAMMAEVRRKLDARRAAASAPPTEPPPPADDPGAEPIPAAVALAGGGKVGFDDSRSKKQSAVWQLPGVESSVRGHEIHYDGDAHCSLLNYGFQEYRT